MAKPISIQLTSDTLAHAYEQASDAYAAAYAHARKTDTLDAPETVQALAVLKGERDACDTARSKHIMRMGDVASHNVADILDVLSSAMDGYALSTAAVAAMTATAARQVAAKTPAASTDTASIDHYDAIKRLQRHAIGGLLAYQEAMRAIAAMHDAYEGRESETVQAAFAAADQWLPEAAAELALTGMRRQSF